tara:strand:- start:7870 stop:18288 length:10419 start_codon:yes stop_codon:yes gene_type:complete
MAELKPEQKQALERMIDELEAKNVDRDEINRQLRARVDEYKSMNEVEEKREKKKDPTNFGEFFSDSIVNIMKPTPPGKPAGSVETTEAEPNASASESEDTQSESSFIGLSNDMLNMYPPVAIQDGTSLHPYTKEPNWYERQEIQKRIYDDKRDMAGDNTTELTDEETNTTVIDGVARKEESWLRGPFKDKYTYTYTKDHPNYKGEGQEVSEQDINKYEAASWVNSLDKKAEAIASQYHDSEMQEKIKKNPLAWVNGDVRAKDVENHELQQSLIKQSKAENQDIDINQDGVYNVEDARIQGEKDLRTEAVAFEKYLKEAEGVLQKKFQDQFYKEYDDQISVAQKKVQTKYAEIFNAQYGEELDKIKKEIVKQHEIDSEKGYYAEWMTGEDISELLDKKYRKATENLHLEFEKIYAKEWEADLNKEIEQLGDEFAEKNNQWFTDSFDRMLKQFTPPGTLIPTTEYDAVDKKFDEAGIIGLPERARMNALNNAWSQVSEALSPSLTSNQLKARKAEFYGRYMRKWSMNSAGEYSQFFFKNMAETMGDKIKPLQSQAKKDMVALRDTDPELFKAVKEAMNIINIPTYDQKDITLKKQKAEAQEILDKNPEMYKSLKGILDRMSTLERANNWRIGIINNPEIKESYFKMLGKGFGHANETDGNIIKYLPFLAGLDAIGEAVDMYELAKKNPKDWTTEERIAAQLFAWKSSSDEISANISSGYRHGKMLQEAAPYIGEFVASGPVFAGTRAVAKKALTKAIMNKADDMMINLYKQGLYKGLTEAGKKQFVKNSRKAILKNRAINGLSFFVGTIAQTTANPQHYIGKTIENMTPELQMQFTLEGDEYLKLLDEGRYNELGPEPTFVEGTELSGWDAAFQGFGLTWAEFATERLGEAVPMLGKHIGEELLVDGTWLKKLYLGWYQKKNKMTPGMLRSTIKKTGWNGILGENFEEWINLPLQNIITGQPLLQGFDGEFLADTFAVTGIMAGAFTGLGGSINLMSGNFNNNPVYNVNDMFFDNKEEQKKEILRRIKTGETADLNVDIQNDNAAFFDILEILNEEGLADKLTNNKRIQQQREERHRAQELEILRRANSGDRQKLDTIDKKLEELNNSAADIKNTETPDNSQLEKINIEKAKLEVEKEKIIRPYAEAMHKENWNAGVDKLHSMYGQLQPGRKLNVRKLNTDEINALKEESILNQKKYKKETSVDGKVSYRNKDGALVSPEEANKLNNEIQEAQAGTTYGMFEASNNELILNIDQAGTAKGVSAVEHEFLHAVLNNIMDNDPAVQHVIGQAMMQHLLRLDPAQVISSDFAKRLAGYQADAMAQGTQAGWGRAQEEVITLYVDAIANGDIKMEEGPMTHLGDIMRRAFRHFGINMKWNDGASVYNWLKDFRKYYKKGKFSSGFIKTQDMQGRFKSKAILGTDLFKQAQQTEMDMRAMEEGEQQAAKSEDAYGINKKYDEKGVAGYEDIIKIYQGQKEVENEYGEKSWTRDERGSMIDKIVNRYEKRARFDTYKNDLRKALAYDPTYGVLGLILKYNQEDNPGVPLNKYINKYLGRKAIDLANQILGKDQAGDFRSNVDDIVGLQTNETGADVLLDQKLQQEYEGEIDVPNLRKELIFRNEKGEPVKGIPEDLILIVKDKVKRIVKRAGSPTDPKFKKKLQDEFKNELFKEIKNRMGAGNNYNIFIEDNWSTINKFIPTSTWVSIERMVPAAERKFTFIKTANMNPTQTQDAIDKGLISPMTSLTAGNDLHAKKKLKKGDMLDWYLNVPANTKGERKTRLAKEIATEMAFDVTMETLKLPDVIKFRKEVTDLKGWEIVNDEAALIAKQIDRDPNYKFSMDFVDSGQFLTEVNSLVPILREKGSNSQEYQDAVDLLNPFTKAFMEELLEKNPHLANNPDGYLNAIKASTNLPKELIDKVRSRDLNLYKGKSLVESVANEYAKNVDRIAKKIDLDMLLNLRSSLDIFNFHYRGLDAAKLKKSTNKPGKYRGLFDSIIENKYKDKNLNFNPGNILAMNKDAAWFNSMINPIFALDGTVEQKLEMLAKVRDQLVEINKANIDAFIYFENKLAENIGGKNGITHEFIIQLHQAQTNLAFGLRALSSIDYLYLEEGVQLLPKASSSLSRKQAANNMGRKSITDKEWVNSPEYKKQLEIYGKTNNFTSEYNKAKKQAKKEGKNNEQAELFALKKAIKKLTIKGEHLGANAITMAEISELLITGKANPESIREVIKDHKQMFGPTWVSDLMDSKVDENGKPKYGGRTNPEGELRILKTLPSNIQNNIYHISGVPAVDHLAEAGAMRAIESLLGSVNELENTKKLVKLYQSKDPAIKQKGISILDFDDTLARSKSGVRYTMPNPTGEPQPGRKVIFLAGGAGSGKSNVVRKLGLEEQGFKIVNSDIALEWLKKNHGLPEDMRDLTPKQLSTLGKLTWEARQIAARKMMKFQGNGDGIIVDGTGGSLKNMQKQVDEFKAKGYDVQMVFVETSLETALQRNRDRKERSLRDGIVKRNHEKVQGNKEAFKELFGNNFAEVKTDKLGLDDPMPNKLVKKLDKFTKGYIKGRIDATGFAQQGADLLAKGAEFDFSEFNLVVEGSKGPLFEKAQKLAEKYGTKDMFILTARPAESQKAIYEFMKSQGLEIPLKNITGLANSTSEAKALWVAEKIGEGYNDIYFADDHLENVQAVKNMVDQFDVKGKVQQAKYKESKDYSGDFNNILEESTGMGAQLTFSEAVAQLRGSKIGNWRFFVPPSADDFKGLLYYFLTKGKKGDEQMAWFQKTLLDPFNRAMRDLNSAKQSITSDYKLLRKQMPGVVKNLNNIVEGTDFTYDQAIRVYLWAKNDIEIPGISNRDTKTLVNTIENDQQLKTFADFLGKLTKQPEGYVQPSEYWTVTNIGADLESITSNEGRDFYLQEFKENRRKIFGEWYRGRLIGPNMNKIEALYGSRYREALEDILWRMENGTNRGFGSNRLTNSFSNWVNNSVGAIMFFNARSAILQTLSTVNFINWSDNNILKAGLAFANQPQFWKDFSYIFNSDMLKQRRGGQQRGINEAELAEAVKGKKNKAQAALKWLLTKGFLPTQIADSFAIASGGATFYRNRIKTYLKKGLSQKEAEQKAFDDFQAIAEETQQSARPDFISQQQASPLGRFILAFQNTPMQYTRLTKKAALDLINGRGDWKTNVSKMMYYGALQNLIFASLQSALFALMFDDFEEEDEKTEKRYIRIANTMLDSILRGTGVGGAVASTLKNMIIEFEAQESKDWGSDHAYTLIAMANLSPPIGSKLRKLYSGIQSYRFNKDVIPRRGLTLDNPMWQVVGNVTSALTNLPLDRVVNKANNVAVAIDQEMDTWQRVALILGWNKWDLGIKDEDIEKIKATIKEEKKEASRAKQKEKRRKKQEERKKNITPDDRDGDGKKEVRCNAKTSSGARCKNVTEYLEHGLCGTHLRYIKEPGVYVSNGVSYNVGASNLNRFRKEHPNARLKKKVNK